jgi:hypothetical protein
MDRDGVGDWRAGRPLVENWAEGAARSSYPSSSSLVAAITVVLANGDLVICHLGVIVVFGCRRQYFYRRVCDCAGKSYKSKSIELFTFSHRRGLDYICI